MGAIKDVVDLATDLSKRVQDRQIATELMDIVRLILSLQSEHSTLHDRCHDLSFENSELKKQILALKSDNSDLKKKISDPKIQTHAEVPELSEEAVAILVFIEKAEECDVFQISQYTSINKTRVEYWVGELSEMELLHCSFSLDGPVYYSLDHGGRKFLIDSGLI